MLTTKATEKLVEVSATQSVNIIEGTLMTTATATLTVDGQDKSQKLNNNPPRIANDQYVGATRFILPESGDVELSFHMSWVVQNKDGGGYSVPVQHPIFAPIGISFEHNVTLTQ